MGAEAQTPGPSSDAPLGHWRVAGLELGQPALQTVQAEAECAMGWH